MNIKEVLEEAAKDHIKKLFETYISNMISDSKEARPRYENGKKLCLDALKELSDG
jgi:hypothetical protein